jgi:O-antigen/teichoic acid export membrane protein
LSSPLRTFKNLTRTIRTVIPDRLAVLASWSLLDQSIVSGTNFIVMILAARTFGPATFGIFAFLITVLTFMEATQRSLITTPHNVIGVNKPGESYARYTSTLGVAQLGLAGVFALATAIAGLVILQFHSQAGLLTIATGFAAAGWQLQEFTRRVLFTEHRLPAVVAGDATAYLGRTLLVIALFVSGSLSAPLLMVLYGGTWFAGAIVGFWNIRGVLVRSFDRAYVRENWDFGRWLFASNAVGHLPQYVLAALLSSVLSVSAYGAYRAFEQLANGTNVPLSALSNVLRPRMARQARYGPASVWRMMVPIMVAGGASLLLFALAYVVFRNQLISTIYGPEYALFSVAIFLIAFRPFLTLQKSILTKALQAFRDTRNVFAGNLAGVGVGSIAGGALIILFGLPAAGAVVILSSVITIAWYAWRWSEHLTNEANWTIKSRPDQPVAAPDQTRSRIWERGRTP